MNTVFKKVVERLNLKHPVAEIAEKTSENKGNVSKFLNGKAEPSISFLKRFCQAFSLDYATEFTSGKTVGDLIDALKIHSRSSYLTFPGDLTFFRVKNNGDDAVFIEFNEIVHEGKIFRDGNISTTESDRIQELKDTVDRLKEALDDKKEIIAMLKENVKELKSKLKKYESDPSLHVSR